MLEFIILGTLLNNTLTGYDIRKLIELGIGMFYKASYGSIYPLLSRLLEHDMVLCIEDPDANRKQKKYMITEKGREYFKSWLCNEEISEQKEEAFMAKVFFFDQLNEREVFAQLLKFERRIEEHLNELYKKREDYLSCEKKECFYYKLSTLYFGIAKLQSLLEWCEVLKNRQPLENLVCNKFKED